ncbi:MAG: NlpC/P60 family protein [Blautia sp.]
MHYYYGGGHGQQVQKAESHRSVPPQRGLYDLDCSGFTSWAYNTCGYSDLCGNTTALLAQGRHVSWSDIRPADMIVSDSHVLLFVSTGQ